MAVLIADSPLALREFVMEEPVPLGAIHETVLAFLRDREDAVVYGAQAVNSHVAQMRMTEDVDLASTRAKELAEELRDHLARRFHLAIRVREVRDGLGYRVYQARRTGNRHLVDIRSVSQLPECERRHRILVVTALQLVAEKVFAYAARRNQPKGGTDWRDIAQLLLAFPGLKVHDGDVQERLKVLGAGQEVLLTWRRLVDQPLAAEDEESEFDW